MFENLDVWTIVSAVLGLVSLVAGSFWLKAKGRLALVAAAGKQVVDVVEVLQEVLVDDKVDQAEVDKVKKELQEAKEALKAVVAKQV